MKHLPNMLTLGNLLCGCLGVWYAPHWPVQNLAYFVWAAAAFDFLDGYVARWLKASSAIGKELDSLADLVSFGLLPATVMAIQINQIWPNSLPIAFALVLVVCAALRLAKFNTDERQTTYFIGLPTPANALFITGLPFLAHTPIASTILANGVALCAIAVLSALLMVSPIHFFALKISRMQWAGNQGKIVFLAAATILLATMQTKAISLVILLYMIVSVALPKNQNKPSSPVDFASTNR